MIEYRNDHCRPGFVAQLSLAPNDLQSLRLVHGFSVGGGRGSLWGALSIWACHPRPVCQAGCPHGRQHQQGERPAERRKLTAGRRHRAEQGRGRPAGQRRTRASCASLRPTPHAYLRWRNADARHRDVLAAERRERARIRSEKGIRWRSLTRSGEPVRSEHWKSGDVLGRRQCRAKRRRASSTGGASVFGWSASCSRWSTPGSFTRPGPPACP